MAHGTEGVGLGRGEGSVEGEGAGVLFGPIWDAGIVRAGGKAGSICGLNDAAGSVHLEGVIENNSAIGEEHVCGRGIFVNAASKGGTASTVVDSRYISRLTGVLKQVRGVLKVVITLALVVFALVGFDNEQGVVGEIGQLGELRIRGAEGR